MSAVELALLIGIELELIVELPLDVLPLLVHVFLQFLVLLFELGPQYVVENFPHDNPKGKDVRLLTEMALLDDFGGLVIGRASVQMGLMSLIALQLNTQP